MPIQRCTKDGKSGFRYGPEGFCYTGPRAREKARKQGQAIEINKHRGKAILTKDEILRQIGENLKGK